MAKSLAFWFRRKFNLPPTDPRFLDATIDDMAAEYWAWHFVDNPEEKEVVDEGFDMNAEIAAANAEADTMPNDFEEI